MAAISGAVVLAWYAMPDFIRSRGLRAVAKTALLGVTAVGAAELWRAHGDDAQDFVEDNFGELAHKPAVIAGAVAGGAVLTVLGEKLLFGIGERRRARGKKLGHTVPALVYAALTAVSTAVPMDDLEPLTEASRAQ